MTIGTILLILLGVLIYLGFMHRILDRLHLNDRQALVIIGLIIVGGFIDFTLIGRPYEMVINVGGGLIPFALIAYIFAKCDTNKERVRAIVASIITAGTIFAIVKSFSFEPNSGVPTFLDPSYIFAIIAGLVAYIAGRSRRAAFIAGVLGIILNDLAAYIQIVSQNVPGRVFIGGAGFLDTTLIAGILAVLLAELIGETRERIQGGPVRGDGKPEGLEEPQYSGVTANKDKHSLYKRGNNDGQV